MKEAEQLNVATTEIDYNSGSRFVKWFLLSFAILSLAIFSWKRTDILPWIGDCKSQGYKDGNFLAYCHSSRYGDYEHSAYWNELEKGIMDKVKKADVLFLGNSRTQYAFSTDAVTRYFSESGLSYYVFGFGMGSQNLVPESMAEKFNLRPKALVINADPFFTDYTSRTNQHMLEQSLIRDWEQGSKRWLQNTQRELCLKDHNGLINWLFCSGRQDTLYRDPENGHWQVEYFRKNQRIPVAIDNNINLYISAEKAAGIAQRFVKKMGVSPECTILTVTPRTATPLAFAQELAEILNFPGIFPMPENLVTVDASHLDPDSAMRWSAEFLRQASPILERCGAGSDKQ